MFRCLEEKKKFTKTCNRTTIPQSSTPCTGYYNDGGIHALYATASRKIYDECRSPDIQPLVTALPDSLFLYVGSEGKKNDK